jgi:integrase
MLEQRHIAKLLAEWRPHARANWLSTLRGLLNFAVAEGLIKENAAKAVK